MLFRPLAFLVLTIASHAAEVKLFDGKSFEGWEGETTKVWRIEDGTITGGSMEGNPQNEFLATKKSFRNFVLRLEYKLIGTEGFVNGGVQIRSQRTDHPPNEMIGYQADIGANYTGFLYDESRRKKVLAAADAEAVKKIEKPGEWNAYEIRATGGRVRLFVNGTPTIDYTETEPGIEQSGRIALQIHGDCKAVISYRNITIEELPDDLVPEQTEILNRFGDGAVKSLPPTFKDGTFGMAADEIIVFTGQENLVREQKSGTLEAVLSIAHSAKNPRFRSMAWEGDTVYEQWRDLNFGAWESQLKTVGATTVVCQLGQMEAFDGAARLPEFIAAYHRLLDQFSPITPRIVLLSPTPFEKPVAPDAPDLTTRNTDAALYTKAIGEIAKQRGAVFIDLFTPLSKRPANAPRLTDNGVHFNETGLAIVAEEIAGKLGATKPASDLTDLRGAIAEKNRLWFDCWRPANWSFVYGDRISQRFGKPGGDEPSLRESFENRKPLIAEWDGKIQALARGEKVSPPPAAAEPVKAPDVLSPEEQLAGFTIAEGYEINLFAAETEGVIKPTQFSWDEKGRLYVACSSTYPQTIPGAKPSDFILVLQDTDGDGKADKSHRFAEGLTMVQGVEPGDGGLYVCDFDRIIHLTDTDGDGKADQTRIVFSGFGIGDTHQLVNSISHGPDGSLWFSQGLHAFSRVESPWGLAKLEKSGVWRLNKRTLRLDAFFNGGKAGHNCWGVAFDDYGQVFHKSGDRPDGYYTVPGMVRLPNPDEYHPTGALFDSSPKTTALEIIGTKALPEDIQGCALIGGYFGSVVELHRFSDSGSGFKTEQLPRLLTSSNNSFRPVDVSIGPDGAIYIADWFNPVIGHYQASYADPQRDRSHGRIWRITAKGKAPIKQPELASMKPIELFEQLRSPERWTRAQAKRLLFDAPREEVLAAADHWLTGLEKSDPDHERLLLELIGVYQAHETVRPELLDRLLSAKDARVRAYGNRVVGLSADRLDNPLKLLEKSIRDENPRVRLEAIVASSYVKKPESVGVATQALESPRDPFIDYALAQSVRSLKPVWQPVFSQLKFGSAVQTEYIKKANAEVEAKADAGKAIYESLCLNCHQPGGKGLAGVYPPLTPNEWTSGDKNRLIKILLHGLTGPILVAGTEYGKNPPTPMPPMGLDDQQIADVLTFIRSNFGNQSPKITPIDVKTVRDQNPNRSTFWTAEELEK